jgi:hypothetical protein
VPSYQSYSIMAYGLLSSFLIRYFSGMCNELRSFAMYAIIRDSAIMHDAQAHDDGSARTDSFITSISSCAGTGMARVACADTHGTCVPSRTVVYPPSRMKLQLARKRGRTVQVEFSVFCRTTIDSYHARDRSRLLDLLPFFIRGKAQHNVLCAATLMHTAHFGYACLKSLAFINAAGRVRVPFIIKSFCRNIVCRIAGTRVIPEAYSYNAVIRRLIKRIDSKSAFIHNNATEYRTKYRRLSMLRIIFSRRLHAGKFSGAKRRRARRNGAKRKQHSLSRMHALYDEQRRHASSDARSRVANMHWRNGSYRYKPTRAMRLYHMRRFYTFFRIVYIVDRSSVPHNGCRLRRK